MSLDMFGPPLSMYNDGFNRANGAIGADYSTDTANPLVISGNKLQITPQAMNTGVASFINTIRGGGNDGKFFTDNHELRVQLTPSSYSLATNNPFLLFIAGSDGTYTSGVNVLFGGYSGGSTSSVIQTGSGSTYTTRASASSQIPTNALVQFRRLMTSATTSIFTVLVNGAAFLSWQDTGGIIPAGASQRRARVGLSGNYPFFQQQFQCASIDEAWAYDLAA